VWVKSQIQTKNAQGIRGPHTQTCYENRPSRGKRSTQGRRDSCLKEKSQTEDDLERKKGEQDPFGENSRPSTRNR